MRSGKSRTLSSTFFVVAAIICLGVVFAIAGCAQNSPYHTLLGESGNCIGKPTDETCTKSYYQEHDGYDLAFAEYSERGNAFSDTYVSDVLDRINQYASGDGVVLVTFIHGWKHNASESNLNLLEFKKELQFMRDILQEDFGNSELGQRRLIGLYIGWRGANLNVPLLENLTFWDRKAVAEEVGKGGVTSLLLELDQITHDNDRNVMVVIGHSFGGAIVINALNDVLTERTIQRSRQGYARTIGDGVLVLNPAIEANQALAFVEAAIQSDYRPEQHPLFVSLSTDADSATHYAFPIGQSLSLILTWQQEDLEREYYYDRLKPDEKKALSEEHLDTTTIGNFAPFLTHRLIASGEGKQTKFHMQTCSENPQGCEPRGLTTLAGQPAIRELPEHYSLYFFKTDSSIMTGHNDIFKQQVRAFILTIIDDVVRRNLERIRAKRADPRSAAPPTILVSPDSFEKRIEAMLRKMPDSDES